MFVPLLFCLFLYEEQDRHRPAHLVCAEDKYVKAFRASEKQEGVDCPLPHTC